MGSCTHGRNSVLDHFSFGLVGFGWWPLLFLVYQFLLLVLIFLRSTIYFSHGTRATSTTNLMDQNDRLHENNSSASRYGKIIPITRQQNFAELVPEGNDYETLNFLHTASSMLILFLPVIKQRW